MLEFRITKYDPALRDANGAFLGDDWISFGEIGDTFNGKELTITEYERVERAYVVTAVQFLRDRGAREINLLRKERGRSKVDIHQISCVLAEDGKWISSTRIFRGEIDEHGHLLPGEVQ